MAESQSDIQKFYDGQTVFITGGTGFMGKILLEKLLRTCNGIKKVYLLMRPKKNVPAEERIKKMISEEVFSVLYEQQPNFKEKIGVISGDCVLPNMGLSEDDLKTLIQEVSIVFHMAATTRFDETLATAIRINVMSVKSVIDLCTQMKNFKAGVYVSTAYSQCVRFEVDEKIYDGPLNYDECVALTEIIEKQSTWNNDDKEEITKRFIGNWPNSYTFTKAIAERTIDDYARNLPFCIIRPSIVVSTYNEPIKGWTDNFLGPSGLITAVGMGVVHALLLDEDKKADIVPCDMACHAIVASGWEIGINKRRPVDPVPVYNYVNRGRTTWHDIRHKCMEYHAKHPSVYILYYPCVIVTTSERLYAFYQFFFMCIPAVLIDTFGKFRGQKPMMYKIYKIASQHTKMLKFFSMSEWKFSYKMLDSMWENMSAEDKQLFPFSNKDLDWIDYFGTYVKYLREIYKEKLFHTKFLKRRKNDTHEEGLKHWNKLKIIHYGLMTMVFLLLCWLLYTVFSSLFF